MRAIIITLPNPGVAHIERDSGCGGEFHQALHRERITILASGCTSHFATRRIFFDANNDREDFVERMLPHQSVHMAHDVVLFASELC
jgi:hypothetical protein